MSAPFRTPPAPTRWTIGYVVAFAAVAVLIGYRIWTYSVWGAGYATIYFTAVAVVAVLMFFLAAKGFDHLDTADPVPGRVIAIVPSYREDPQALYATVNALLASTIPPDQIHVVDDGSPDPVAPFEHPRVFWHRLEVNSGKRAAQATVLSTLAPDDFDFLVTVDSDSRVAPTAIESALRAFNDPDVQAVTSIVTVSNRTSSLIARLADLEIVSGIFVVRRSRAALGAVTPTSGAFSMYRTGPILDNLYDYVASGTFSDDRRMAHYCLLRGKVVSVNGALVDTDMPTGYVGTWRQRVRWYKGYWKYWGWETANFTGWPLFLRYMSTLTAMVFPVALVWALIVMPLLGNGVYWPVLVLWLALAYCQTLTYLRRPNIPSGQRWAAWLFLTPLLIPFQTLLVRPAMYWALLTVRSDRWDGERATARYSTAEGE